MIKSESIKELAAALAKAQNEMTNPIFDSVNPHFKNKYSSLAAVRNAVVPVLSKNGLSIMQNLSSTEKGIRCSVIILHSSGEWLEFEGLDLPVSKNDPQGFMSAATYAKRGTLQAIACVVGDADDDGNAASQKQEQKFTEIKPTKEIEKKDISKRIESGFALLKFSETEQQTIKSVLDEQTIFVYLQDISKKKMTKDDLFKIIDLKLEGKNEDN